MSFVSINEIESFRYDDCYIIGRKDTESDIVLEVKALIVKGDNSQNANFTDSYADVAHIIFKKGSIVKGIKNHIIIRIIYTFYFLNIHSLQVITQLTQIIIV